MADALATILAALPGIAALAAGTVRWRTWRVPRRAWGRTPPLVRVALLALAVLALASCHTTHRDHWAKTPVPLDLVPFTEPLRWSVGPDAGNDVPATNGLLATYFRGARYDFIDHQQIDASVDFEWNADQQNPVIPGATVNNEGLDRDECGFCGLPPTWGIWSIVWEGYVEAPTDGDYVLGIHVNNGGWLEMKDPATGTLITVISLPGGPSFEGEGFVTRTLSRGRHYIRFSFFQNGPPSANARLLWQPPGTPGLSVIPSASLFTQDLPGRAFIFVHGIRGSHRDLDSFALLLAPLEDGSRERPARSVVERFRYYQDRGDLADPDDPTSACGARPPIVPSNTGGLPLDLPSVDPAICDSQGNVGLNAILLDEDVRDLHRRVGGKVTILANSMGAAIVRAFLAYAVKAGTGAVEHVDHIYFLQGAQQGSWVAYSKPLALALLAPTGPLRSVVFYGVSEEVRERTGFDPRRPAIDDLLPFFSETYRFVNPDPAHLPDSIGYHNVASDIHWRTDVDLVGYAFGVRMGVRLGSESASWGDYALLPGSDRPTDLPLLGGARFLPSTIGKGSESVQWVLEAEVRSRMEVTVEYIPTAPFVDPSYEFPGDPFGIPESHFAFGRRMNEITVQDPRTGEPLKLDQAILRQIARQDR